MVSVLGSLRISQSACESPRFEVSQQLVQATHARLPALLELCERPAARRTPWGRGHTLGAAVLPLRHQPGTLKHGHVFLHSGKRHVVVHGEFAHGRVGAHYPSQNVPPRGVRERPKQLVEIGRRYLSTYNHLVVDNTTTVGVPDVDNEGLERGGCINSDLSSFAGRA